jgi:rifampicin phosphotransferase
MKYTHSFQDPLATRLEISGGKGSNLSLLTQRGFPVPPGFVLSQHAYRDFIAAGRELLRSVETFHFDDPGRLRSESEQLRQSLEKLQLPAEAAQEVREQLRKLPADQAFSVRSSSTMEDLASAAFAGQHETYLNCQGADLILDRIKACFLSLWFDRAIAYRHQQHFDHALAAMAVVVQQMVPCEVAGVGFSINPVTGDLGEVILDANFGLGESVVSGEGEVDHFVIDKATGAVRSAAIAQKTRKIIGVAGGGTREVRLGAEEGKRPCLDAKQLSALTSLITRVEASYRFPQDIEWGFVGDELFLLQSRPVTTIPPRWTRDESAERFPNVITPLTWDFVESGFHRSLNHSFRLMGFPPFSGKWFGMHGHYIYGNQNAVELYGRRAPFVVRNAEELRAVIPRLREEYRWVQELPVLWARDLDDYLITIGRFLTEPLENKTIPELWRFVMQVNDHGANYFLPNIAISITHSTLYRLLHHLLKICAGPERADSLFDRLMAYCETKTGTINRELFELAVMVRADSRLERLLAERTSREVIETQGLEAFPAFAARLQKFLRDHGHREVDFDAYSPTWLELPWVVLDNVRLILQTPMDQPPAVKERELRIRAQQAELELFQSLPADVHFFFAEILRLARVYTSLDDLEHYQTTRLALPLRRGLRELGSRLVQRGVFSEPMDIFFARQGQIEQAVAQNTDVGWGEFAAAVREQKASYLADRARKPDWVLGVASTPKTDADSLTGLAGSAGVAEGPVFLVLNPEDFAKFPKGAVLVARTTNPTWTPLFYSAVAVITESGGPLSHGAVTAREMRIPAVMSVKESLTRLSNGQRVRVDGTRGVVSLL